MASITDELRKWASNNLSYKTRFDELIAIADRIDEVYEKQCEIEYAKGRMAGSTPDESKWVKLPVDADGVPIRVGDVLDGYGKTIEAVELRHGRSGWVLISSDGNGYANTFAFSHHHAPTVEDVLREMLCSWEDTLTSEGVNGIIAEYAAKLQLKED